jgi:hypothetical protein
LAVSLRLKKSMNALLASLRCFKAMVNLCGNAGISVPHKIDEKHVP